MLVGGLLYFIPYVGTWAVLILLGGYYLTYQRQVRSGRQGLPPIQGAADWLRRGLGVTAILIVLAVPPIVVWLVLVISLHMNRPVTTGVLYVLLLAIVPLLQVLGMRYAAYDRLRPALQASRAVEAIRPYWRSYLRVLAWYALVLVASLLARYVSASLLGVSVSASWSLVTGVTAKATVNAWMALVVSYAISVLSVASGLVSAHLMGQLGAIAYPPGTESLEELATAQVVPAVAGQDSFEDW